MLFPTGRFPRRGLVVLVREGDPTFGLTTHRGRCTLGTVPVPGTKVHNPRVEPAHAPTAILTGGTSWRSSMGIDLMRRAWSRVAGHRRTPGAKRHSQSVAWGPRWPSQCTAGRCRGTSRRLVCAGARYASGSSNQDGQPQDHLWGERTRPEAHDRLHRTRLTHGDDNARPAVYKYLLPYVRLHVLSL